MNKRSDIVDEESQKEYSNFAFEIKNYTINSALDNYDVIIAGAGPAGAACALSLRQSGLKTALLDKAEFPRDKVCGDAIGGNVSRVLRKIGESYADRLEKFPKKNISKGWKLIVPSGKLIRMEFVNPGYISRRLDFDNFLIDLVKENRGISLLERTSIISVDAHHDRIDLGLRDGKRIRTKLLIGCDGARSIVAKKLANFSMDRLHYSGAVRGYFRNIRGIDDHNTIEIFLLRNFLPGYFWIFPFDATSANVGFGMLSSEIGKRKIDLKSSFYNIIRETPQLKDRFVQAEMDGSLDGFGLPLGGKSRPISGERFMLCGDAASLIDPLNGEGISNAMFSGYQAAQQVLRCFSSGDFSGNFMKRYDREVYQNLLGDFRKKMLLQRALNRTWLINGLVSLASSNKYLKSWMGKQL